MTQTELKPCPFCGHSAGVKQMKVFNNKWFAYCDNPTVACPVVPELAGEGVPTRDQAVEIWNQRIPDPLPFLEKLREHAHNEPCLWGGAMHELEALINQLRSGA